MVSKKWIFGGIGWVFGGALGAIFGYGIGSMFDNKQQVSKGTDFELALLSLAAVIIKADGVIYVLFNLKFTIITVGSVDRTFNFRR